ncbi:hypothetical protein [Nocardia nova]|uniref:hypothetical protein n=1 Tax=Nocardia nova TaxID=37330 RepID=UPI0018941AE0|nr:hypothetical protein [Nocardia nova]MBF6277008.1 hypothetical protein [Nocardia nova]
MRRESSWFVRYAGTALLIAVFGIPVLLLITTPWPHFVVAVVSVVSVLALLGLYSVGYQAGYRARDELAYEHAIEAVRFATSDHPEGI